MKIGNPLFLIILLFCSVLPMAFADWYETDYVYFEASPEIITSSGWVEFTLLSKVFSGDCDLVWGFDSSEIQPSSPQIWANFSHSLWRWGSELDINGTIIPMKEYYTEWFFDWQPLGISPTKLSFEHRGMNTWFLFKNVPIVAGKVYKIRAFMKVKFPGLEEIAGKYFFGMKRSQDTVQEAISSGRFFLLDPWYDSTWSHRLKITFDNSASSENLTDFPVMVKLDSSNFDFSLAQPDGDDLYALDPDNTTLAYEIEEYNYTTENAVLWVKVPQINANSTTDFIWLYYGNEEASSNEDKEAVWNMDYVLVQHMVDETNSSISDSTQFENDGTKKDVDQPLEIEGMIYNSQDFDGSEYIIVPSNSSLTITEAFTIEVYTNPDSSPSGEYDALLHHGHNTNEYGIWISDIGKVHFGYGGEADWHTLNGDTQLNGGSWNYVAVSYDETDDYMRIYVNGSADGSLAVDDDIRNVGDGRLIIGGKDFWGSQTELFNGSLDEVRVSSILRSLDWIHASYISMTNKFISYGSPELCDYTLSLQILNGENAVAGATLSLSGEGETHYDVSDSEGWVNLVVPWGSYEITISHAGYYVTPVTFFVDRDLYGPAGLLGVEEGVMIENNIPLMMLSIIPVGLSIQYFRKKELLWAGGSAFMWLIAGVATIQADPSNWVALRVYTLFFVVMLVFTFYTALRWLQESLHPRDTYWDDW